MADPELFARGATIGLTVAIPVGPMAVLCIRETLSLGIRPGLSFGAGIAAADATYAAIAALGVGAIRSILEDYESGIRFVGGLVMIVLGLTIIRSVYQPDIEGGRATRRRPFRDTLAVAYALTMANPTTILVFAAILAGAGFDLDTSGASTAILVAGVFTGSLCWWAFLVAVAASIRVRTTERWLHGFNALAGAVIVLFGVVAVASTIT